MDSAPEAVGSDAASASSEDAAGGRSAANAVDGDPSTEWATGGGGVGSTILLEWEVPREVGAIVLSDRPNLDDNIEAGTLEFSDGSSARVPALPEDGEPLRIEVAPRSVTSVLFRVDAVGPDTTDVGLSEIEANGPDAVASVLGTERILADADAVASIRPHAVSSARAAEGIRQIQVEVEIDALLGSLQPRPSWFVMLGSDGSTYAPIGEFTDEYADPIAADASLEAGEALTATAHFEVASDASGLEFAYAPDGASRASWMLGAP